MAAIVSTPAYGSEEPAQRAPRPLLALDVTLEQLIVRAGFIATGAFLLSTAVQSWSGGNPGVHREVVALVFAQYALAFLLLALGTVAAARMRRLILLIPLATVLGLLSWCYVQIHIQERVYTDGAAFLHVATERTLDGENPYGIVGRDAVESAADRFGLSRAYLTGTTDGVPQEHLTPYPGGSVITLLPSFALGIDDVRWTVVICEIATLALLWFAAPAVLRPLAALPLLVDPQLTLHYTGGGVMDFIWVLPLTACAIALYGKRLWWAALLFGLSAGIKQQPWLLAPFLAVWVWNVADDDRPIEKARQCIAFAGVALAGFLLLNAPFMAWDFRAWSNAIFVPFDARLVPLGSGLSLLTQTGIASLPKGFYSAASMGLLGLLVLAYAVHFRTFKHSLWLASAVVMWFGYRSLQNYFVFWTPMILVALVAWWNETRSSALATAAVSAAGARPLRAVAAAPESRRFALRWLIVPGATVALAAMLTVIALRGSADAALDVDVRVIETSDTVGLGATTHAAVELYNRGDSDVRPRFSVSWLPYPHYWRVISGPALLAPGQRATYEIAPADVTSAPPDGETFQIKVNDAASITYAVAAAVTKPKPELAVVNPGFQLWSLDTTAGRALPAGWTLYEGIGSGDQALVGESDVFGVKALRLRLAQDGRPDAGSWSHTGLVQQVAFPAEAFEVTALTRALFRSDVAGNPTNAMGLEISDVFNGTIWVLFQQTGKGDMEYDLSSGHHIKVFDVPAGQWATRTIDVPQLYSKLNWAPSEEISLRIIAAAASAAPDDIEGFFASIKAAPAATASRR